MTLRPPALALVAACSAVALDAHAAAESPSALELAPGLVQTTLGLAFVVALIFCAAWVIRRISGTGRNGSLIKVVATQALGQKERVVLVEVGDEWILLGVAPGSVRSLKTLPRQVVSTPVVPQPFARLLAAARKGRQP